MKKVIIAFVLLFTGFTTANAQEITIKKVMGSSMFYQNNKRISPANTLELMKGNTDAYQLMKSAKSKSTWASVIGGIGGVLVGFPIGTAIGGGEANWTLAGIGAGLIVASLPLNKAYNVKAQEAIDLYNAGITTTSYQFKPLFNLGVRGNGIAFTVDF